jgi:hypothetical protein
MNSHLVAPGWTLHPRRESLCFLEPYIFISLIPHYPHYLLSNPQKVNFRRHGTEVKGEAIRARIQPAVIGEHFAAIGREQGQGSGTRCRAAKQNVQPVSGGIGVGLDGGDPFVRPFQQKNGAKAFALVVIHTAQPVVGGGQGSFVVKRVTLLTKLPQNNQPEVLKKNRPRI